MDANRADLVEFATRIATQLRNEYVVVYRTGSNGSLRTFQVDAGAPERKFLLLRPLNNPPDGI